MRVDQDKCVYPGAPDTLIARFEQRRHLIKGSVDWGLPPAEAPLAKAKRSKVEFSGPGYKFTAFGRPAEDTSPKLDAIAKELVGQSELELLYSYCTAHLRKRTSPDAAKRLFFRMWEEEAAFLLRVLSGRWLISAMVTLGDHGITETQRKVGFAFNAFFSLMKLYEAERLFSGKPPHRPFRLDRKVSAPMPMGLTQYSMKNGDLDINLLAQLSLEARSDAIAGRIADELLARLNRDNGTVLARMKKMKLAMMEGTEAR